MENASKALIIAGAILLSILIIALGMNIYNSASSSVGKADMSAEEISAHNQRFISYEGKQKGTTIRTLLNIIANNNDDNEDRLVNVTVEGKLDGETSDSAEIRSVVKEIKTNTTFVVEFDYTDNGIINTCNITLYN